MFLKVASTLAWLRYRMFIHRAFHGLGPANLISTVLIGFSVLVLALGIGLGFAIGFSAAVHSNNAALLRVMFTLAFGFIFGMILFLPFLYAGSQEGFDARRCLIFPVPIRHLYVILILSELGGANYGFIYPTLLAVLIMGIMIPGKAVLAGLGVLILFMVLTAIWSNLLLLWLQGLMQKRRRREIIIVLMAFFLLSVSIMPQVIVQYAPRLKDTGFLTAAGDYLKAVAVVLPPVLASRAMTALQEGHGGEALAPAICLLLFILAGVVLGQAVFRRVVLDAAASGGPKAAKPSIVSSPQGARDFGGPILAILSRHVPAETGGVWAKDLRYIYRSAVGKLNLLMVPLLSIFFPAIFSSKKLPSLWGYDSSELLFLLMSIYISMFSSSLFNNMFAWEGQGMKSYFIMPAPGRRVLLGKNLAIWTYGLMLFGIFAATYGMILNLPPPGVFLTAILCFAVALVLFSAAGNIISILFPKKTDVTSWKRSAPSNLAALSSLFVLTATTGLLAPVVLLPAFFHAKHLAPLILLALLCVAGLGYACSLKPAARLLENRKEDLLRTLRSTD